MKECRGHQRKPCRKMEPREEGSPLSQLSTPGPIVPQGDGLPAEENALPGWPEGSTGFHVS